MRAKEVASNTNGKLRNLNEAELAAVRDVWV